MNEDFNLTINAELFDADLDDVGFDPEIIDDSDDTAAEQFGYE